MSLVQQTTHLESVKLFSLNNTIRVVTAASLFDGHDAAIQIMRRIFQAEGAEVIHLGHDRSVQEVVDCAISEDAHVIAVSSYQGGHIEYFTYMRELLNQKGAAHILIVGGGGGVIVAEEIALLAKHNIRIFSPEDGRKYGLQGMIQQVLSKADASFKERFQTTLPQLEQRKEIAEAITTLELAPQSPEAQLLRKAIDDKRQDLGSPRLTPVLGFTGTGGAGKSSLIDEILLRYLDAFTDKTIAIVSVDPTRRRSGGALLGDRIRMNSAKNERVFMRSMATRRAHSATSAAIKDTLELLQVLDFDLILLETAGIGQSDSEVTELVDHSVYVMTPEFGAPSQLEKIDMLDFADTVVINKFDKYGAKDALKHVQKTVQRNRKAFDKPLDSMPVYPTSAHHFHDAGTNALFNHLFEKISKLNPAKEWKFNHFNAGLPEHHSMIPARRSRYLGEISETIHNYHLKNENHAQLASQILALKRTLALLDIKVPEPWNPNFEDFCHAKSNTEAALLLKKYLQLWKKLPEHLREQLSSYDQKVADYKGKEQFYTIRNREIKVTNHIKSLSNLNIAKVCPPTLNDWGDRLRFLSKENLPGFFPFTAGVFPFKRTSEDPTRMFAGEGTPERTNARFHYLAKNAKGVRLSTAFDSVTLYGANPDVRPDIFGKIGNAGVNVCCLDDAKRLYSGFDLLAAGASVSMTINGPAPTILAFFFNAVIDAECEKVLKEQDRWQEIKIKIDQYFAEKKIKQPTYRTELPAEHNGNGLGFLGLTADQVMDLAEYTTIKERVLKTIRGTVQADILKEDQAQNTCIFSTEFALKMMGDVQEFFVHNGIRNFYSVSISGYHIAEAGANPITQLAFTLANGFTLLEYYRARGLEVDAFAANFSFFFSNGLDPEYAVIGRVARRIWSIALKEIYGANERSQKLKYHIQTSGRSLHAQEIQFNDIRTTLQALLAITDNCNSLHTNAYDEAITTPTEESVRRALAIQLIINRELGMTKNENPIQGSYFIDAMTDLVENAVLQEFEAMDMRGGVLGAMETMYQRGKIQEESMFYEEKKHSGELPIIGVNTFLNPVSGEQNQDIELIRSSDLEKQQQIDVVEFYKNHFAEETKNALDALKSAAQNEENLFAELMNCSKFCTLGLISDTLYKTGGAYRRSM